MSEFENRACVSVCTFRRDNCITENVTSKRSLVSASPYLHIAAFVGVRTTSVSCASVCVWLSVSVDEMCNKQCGRRSARVILNGYENKPPTEQTERHTRTRGTNTPHTAVRASSSCLKMLEVRPLFPQSAEICIWTHRHRNVLKGTY